MKKKKWPFVVGGIVVLIVLIAAFGGGKSAKKVNSSGETAEDVAAQEETKDKFEVGDTVELNGVQVTLTSVTESTGSQYMKPDDGKVFLLCNFEIVNGSKSDITVSSIVSFEAYCDDYSINQSMTAVAADNSLKQLDGSVAVGKKMNGVIGYEVSSDWNALEISYSPSFWGNKKMTFEALH